MTNFRTVCDAIMLMTTSHAGETVNGMKSGTISSLSHESILQRMVVSVKEKRWEKRLVGDGNQSF